MDFEQFKAKLSNLSEDGTFTFGKNWIDFINHRVNDKIIGLHHETLRKVLVECGIHAKNSSVIDIGCGSGISSLAFLKMQPRKLKSVDIDENSIRASNIIKSQYAANESDLWEIRQASVFDLQENSEKYDIVYSWGVLHHTGNVWEAIRKAASIVNKGGHIYLALYKSGNLFSNHVETKVVFKNLSRDEKISYLYRYLNHFFLSRGASVFEVDSRGMNRFHDALDWLGGFPYEVVDPDVLRAYMSSIGFDQIRYIDANEGGCFTYIGKRRSH